MWWDTVVSFQTENTTPSVDSHHTSQQTQHLIFISAGEIKKKRDNLLHIYLEEEITQSNNGPDKHRTGFTSGMYCLTALSPCFWLINFALWTSDVDTATWGSSPQRTCRRARNKRRNHGHDKRSERGGPLLRYVSASAILDVEGSCPVNTFDK